MTLSLLPPPLYEPVDEGTVRMTVEWKAWFSALYGSVLGLINNSGGGSTGKQTIWVPSSTMNPNITNGALFGSYESATNKVNNVFLDFADGSTVIHAWFDVQMPKSWDAGTVTVEYVWAANSSSTNAVVLQTKAVAIATGTTLDPAWGTTVSTVTANTGTYDLNISTESTAITVANAAVQNLVKFDISRDPTNGSDILAATVRLIGVSIYYTTIAGNDA